MQEKPFNGIEPKKKEKEKRRSTLVQSRETPLRLYVMYGGWKPEAVPRNISTFKREIIFFCILTRSTVLLKEKAVEAKPKQNKTKK